MITISKLLTAGIFIVFSGVAHAADSTDNFSGSWYDPERPGHGFSIEAQEDDRLAIYWYAYHPDGSQMWLESVADIDGQTASGDAYYHTGMKFGEFDSANDVQHRWGVLSFELLDCYRARMSYESVMEHGGVPYGSGEIDLVRLTLVDGQRLDCPTSLEPGFHGTYRLDDCPTELEEEYPGEVFSDWCEFDEGFISIHPGGDLAYRAVKGRKETGVGRVTMIGEKLFYFESVTSLDYATPRDPEAGFRQGIGWLQDGQVTLDLGELGELGATIKPEFYHPLSLQDFAGSYAMPNSILPVYYRVSEEGAVTWDEERMSGGSYVFHGSFSGTLTVPRSDSNQFILEGEYVNDTCVPGLFCWQPHTFIALGEIDPETGDLNMIEQHLSGWSKGSVHDLTWNPLDSE